MNAFGSMIARLRRTHGLTQTALATMAGCDEETIAKVEQGRGRWRPATARRVYEVLTEYADFSQADYDLFSKTTGLTLRRFRHPQGEPGPRQARRTPEQTQELLNDLLFDLVARYGAEGVEQIMRGLLSLPRHADDDADDLSVVHPPVQREGFYEQRETHYSRRPAPPDETPRRKAR